ncbi:MAG: glycerophosphodiester phosphodiesterase [Rectinemataceae bacterium]
MEKPPVIVFAHRGFRAVAPENTLAAARAALAIGARWWELDVAASSDGELIVIHDDSLARTSDAAVRFPERSPWSVYDFTQAEIESLDAGSWYAASDPFGQIKSGFVSASDLARFAGERIPSLRACLEFTKAAGISVNVEIKNAEGRACHPWLAERVVELLREHDMVGSVLLSSFNHEYIVRAKRAAPGLRTGALVEGAAPDPVALLDSSGASSYNPDLETLTEAAVHAVRASGRDVFVWTVNEEADMERLIDWGVSGIFTDFPDRLFRVLREAPVTEYPPPIHSDS